MHVRTLHVLATLVDQRPKHHPQAGLQVHPPLQLEVPHSAPGGSDVVRTSARARPMYRQRSSRATRGRTLRFIPVCCTSCTFLTLTSPHTVYISSFGNVPRTFHALALASLQEVHLLLEESTLLPLAADDAVPLPPSGAFYLDSYIFAGRSSIFITYYHSCLVPASNQSST